MSKSFLAAVALGALLIAALAFAAPADAADEDLFENSIRPVLLDSCLRCHGGRETNGGLKVLSRVTLLQGGDSGPAIAPGNAEGSLLMQAIRRTHESLQMPPDVTLEPHVVDAFARWIDAGAVWPQNAAALPTGRHWAFESVKAIPPPDDPTGWSAHPIDRFASAKWREKGLAPAPDADAVSLVRRLYIDTIGLPPSAEEAEAFVTAYAIDPEQAIAHEVDRLLASPRYGERWGRHWLDVARYADTAGDNADYPVPEARRYRDYVIDAFNADKPFDEFAREQIAGDLLAREEYSQGGSAERFAELTSATGFLALSRRYATGPYELWHLTLEDTIDAFGQAFLGLTLRCARCHDHKFDPVTSADYYALYGVFQSTRYPWAGGEEFQSKSLPRQAFVSLAPPDLFAAQQATFDARLTDLAGKILELEKRAAECSPEEKAAIDQQLAALRSEEISLKRSSLPPETPGAYAVGEGDPKDAAIQLQGDPSRAGATVPRGAIAFLTPEPLAIGAHESGRRQLAEWLTRADHPLTSRVIVNRLWQHHFGKGIVATPSNFGLRGAAPTHPELLDYLADRLVSEGWSLKALHRLILTSRLYRLAVADVAPSTAIDTGNQFLWRANRRRLDAETLRDSWLAVAGELDLHRPGDHPFPPMRDWHWTQHNPFKVAYDSRHRTVYWMTQRLQKHPFLALFDGPDTNASTEKRGSSTVPTQALYWMNSVEVASIAASFADRLARLWPENEVARIDAACRVCFARPATRKEIIKAQRFFADWRGEASKLALAGDAYREPWTSYLRVLVTSNEFLYVE